MVTNNRLYKDNQDILVTASNFKTGHSLKNNFDNSFNRDNNEDNFEAPIPNNDTVMTFNEPRQPNIEDLDGEQTTLSESTSNDGSNDYVYAVPAIQQQRQM